MGQIEPLRPVHQVGHLGDHEIGHLGAPPYGAGDVFEAPAVAAAEYARGGERSVSRALRRSSAMVGR